MKWYWWVLGTIGVFVIFKGVDNYRTSHVQTSGTGNGSTLDWSQALKGWLGMAHYPTVQQLAPGQTVNLAAGAQPNPYGTSGGVYISYTKL